MDYLNEHYSKKASEFIVMTDSIEVIIPNTVAIFTFLR
jgi:hypothetical protein